MRILLQVSSGWMGYGDLFVAPDLARAPHLFLLLLLLATTAVGGFVAGRVAESSHLLNGLLVGVTGILAATVSNPGLVPVPPLLIAVQALSMLSGALGGLLARAVGQHQEA